MTNCTIRLAKPRLSKLFQSLPVLVVVAKPGQSLSENDMREYLKDKVASWWLPDAVEFVAEIPHGGTGKVSKKDLREQFRDHRLPTA